MFPTNTYRIWLAGADDEETLSRLAHKASEEPLAGCVLIGEIDGTLVAALSLHDGRVLNDPSQRADRMVATLRMRAAAIRAYETTPTLPARLRTALPAYRGESVVMPEPAWRDGYDEDEPLAA
jgi:hypothetical protein